MAAPTVMRTSGLPSAAQPSERDLCVAPPKRKADSDVIQSTKDDSIPEIQRPPAKKARKKIVLKVPTAPKCAAESTPNTLKREADDAELPMVPSDDTTEETERNSANKSRKKAEPTEKKTRAAATPKITINTSKKTTSPKRKPRQKGDEKPLPPTAVTCGVKSKIKQVKQYLASGAESKIQRDTENPNLVIVDSRTLFGAAMHFRGNYEMDDPGQTEVSDVEQVIVSKTIGTIGTEEWPCEWCTIDISKMTKLEEAIKAKIARHGLDDVSLLEIELELTSSQNVKRIEIEHNTLYRSEDKPWIASEAVKSPTCNEQGQQGDPKIATAVGRDDSGLAIELEKLHDAFCAGQEIGKIGVCPAAKHEV